jgi:hypothetical protein
LELWLHLLLIDPLEYWSDPLWVFGSFVGGPVRDFVGSFLCGTVGALVGYFVGWTIGILVGTFVCGTVGSLVGGFVWHRGAANLDPACIQTQIESSLFLPLHPLPPLANRPHFKVIVVVVVVIHPKQRDTLWGIGGSLDRERTIFIPSSLTYYF